MNNKILVSLILGVFLMVSVFALTMTTKAVAVSSGSAKSTSINGQDYSFQVVKSSTGANLIVNGEEIENVQAGDVVNVDGNEIEITDVKGPTLFRNNYQVKAEISGEGDNSGNGNNPPQGQGDTINANSCNADAVCEMTQGIVNGQLTVLNLGVSDGFAVGDEDSYSLAANIDGGAIATKGFHVLGGLVSDTFYSNLFSAGIGNAGDEYAFMVSNDSVFFSSGIGTGNAYACFNSEGKIYRSKTACV